MYIDVLDSSSKWVGRVFPQKSAPSGTKITVKLVLGSREGHNYYVGFGSNRQSGTATVYFKITNYIASSTYTYVLHTMGDELTGPYDNYPRGYPPSGRRWRNYDNYTNTGGEGTNHSGDNYNFDNDIFTGWTYSSNTYVADGELVVRLGQTYTLTANWNTDSHYNYANATVTWKNGSSRSTNSLTVGDTMEPPALPTKTGYRCLGWFGPDGRVCYGGDYIPCTITYSAVYELESVLTPKSGSTSSIHYDVDDILVYEDTTGTSTSTGTIYGKVNLIVANQENNNVDMLYLFQAKHSSISGDSWFDQSLQFDIRSYSAASGGTALTTNSYAYNTWHVPHYTATDNGVYKYVGLRTRSGQPNSKKFAPLTEEYCLGTADYNTKLVSKPTGSIGTIQFTMPAPDSSGISTAYVDFHWNWVKGSNSYGVDPFFRSGYDGITSTRLKVTFDWNVRYYKNYPNTTQELFTSQIKGPNTAYTIINDKPAAPSGYRFVCWNTLEDGSGTPYYPGDIIPDTNNDGNWKLYAQWELGVMTLTFDPNGGACSESSREVLSGEPYGDLPTAYWIGYKFLGWYTASSGGTKVSSTTIMGSSNTTIYAQWEEDWAVDVDGLTFLHYDRPKVRIGVRRDCLQNPDGVRLWVQGELHPILDINNKDKNFVSDVSDIWYRPEGTHKNSTSWTDNTGATHIYDSRTYYNWQTTNSESDIIKGISENSYKTVPFETGILKDKVRTNSSAKQVSIDIDNEYQFRCKLRDALQSYATSTATKYSGISDWSNVALLLKYITKLLVHNPYMDEVIKESRDNFTKKLRNPVVPDTDFWQIREHSLSDREHDWVPAKTESELLQRIDSLLTMRSNDMSVNGFDRSKISDYIIPTLKRALTSKERLVYDYSQIEKVLAILNEINSEHSKIKQEVQNFGLANQAYNNQYQEVIVGDYDSAKRYDQRILELDGERHQTSTNWETESDTLQNRVRDTSYKDVELANFNDEQVEDQAQSTIDHIKDYDISQIDLERSLSDFIYILSRMSHRPANSEYPTPSTIISKISSVESIQTAYNNGSATAAQVQTALNELDALISNYGHYETEENDSWVWNSTSGFEGGKWNPNTRTWADKENDISAYSQYDFVDNYQTITDPNHNYENNGCNATCMGLCTTGCYGTCVGGCNTACGSSCFYGCDTTCRRSCGVSCGDSCGTGCAGSCSGGCQGSCVNECASGCGNSCKGNCTGGCDAMCGRGCNNQCTQNCASGCTTSCTGGCTKSCGSNCFGSCTGGCKETCKAACKKGCGAGCNISCTSACATSCSRDCASSCSGTCSGSCQGHCKVNCDGGCEDTCERGVGQIAIEDEWPISCKGNCKTTCYYICQFACSNGCSSGCSSSCGKGCSNDCYGYCKESCQFGCQNGCEDYCNSSCYDSCDFKCGGTCKLDCKQTCNNTCGSACGYSCVQVCSGNCTSACKGTCKNACEENCTSTCTDDCEYYCRYGCASTCDHDCEDGCVVNCKRNCDNICYGNCESDCYTTCKTSCINGCSSNACKNNCSASCSNDCEGECALTCTGDCSITCNNGCEKTCYSKCKIECKENCSTDCYVTCGSICSNGCHKSCGSGCSTACEETCYGACASSCFRSCNNKCTGDCFDSCGKQCASTCTANCVNDCSDVCTNNCNSTCGNTCTAGCGNDCSGGCGKCSTTCKSDCYNDCFNACKTACNSNCTSDCVTQCSVCSSECTRECTYQCMANCSQTCGESCNDGCNTACSANCGGNCQGICKRNCKTTCTGGCTGCTSGCSASCGGDCKSQCLGTCNTTCFGNAFAPLSA